MQTKKLALKHVTRDLRLQMRAERDEDYLEQLTQAVKEGRPLKGDPPVVFNDGTNNWLADGYTRFEAHERAGMKLMHCEIKKGTFRDALLFAAGANAAHGRRRSPEDKRRAVESLLADAEWSRWSNGAIAKACGVSDEFVRRMRQEVTPNVGSESPAERTYTTKHGNVSTMRTANIGRRKDESEGTGTADAEPERGREEWEDEAEADTPAYVPAPVDERLPLLDELGRPLPPHLRSVFGAADEVPAEARPFVVCPGCDGGKLSTGYKVCPTCKGEMVLTRRQFAFIPQGLQLLAQDEGDGRPVPPLPEPPEDDPDPTSPAPAVADLPPDEADPAYGKDFGRVDRFGTLIPEDLLPTWDAWDRWARVQAAAHVFGDALRALHDADAGRYVDTSVILAEIEKGVTMARMSIVYCLCPACGGDPGRRVGCKACEGRGWMNQYQQEVHALASTAGAAA